MKIRKSLLAVPALAALAPFALAQKAAAPVDLGTFGGTFSQAQGVNSVNGNDIVVGGANVFTDAYQHAFYTYNGYLEELGTLIGPYSNSYANAISPKGSVVGYADQIIDSDGDTASHAVVFGPPADGPLDLGTNGGTLSWATGITGPYVIGYSTISEDVAYCAFVWTKAGGILNLNTLADDDCTQGYNSYAFGISDKGLVVGSSDSPDGTTHAAAWNPKTLAITDLGNFGGTYAQVNAANGTGLMVGFATSPSGNAIVAVTATQKGGLVSIGGLGGAYAQAMAVNDSGTVVGFSNITGDTDVHAFVYTTAGGLVDLNSILPSGSPFIELNSANAIAPDGTIVGVGTALDGQAHAFAW